MNYNLNSIRNAARKESQQRKIDAGFVRDQFPEVADIVVSMMYHLRGPQKSFPRVINFFPESYAFFRITCLTKDCIEGGFDFTQIITGMIRNHRQSAKGDIRCEGDGHSSSQPTVDYEVAIKYA